MSRADQRADRRHDDEGAVLALGHLGPTMFISQRFDITLFCMILWNTSSFRPRERAEVRIGRGVADHDVDLAVGLARESHQVFELGLVGDAGGNRRRLAARVLDALHDFLAGRQLAAGDDDLGAVRRHLLADRSADAAAAAGHHGHLAAEVEHHVALPSLVSRRLSGAREQRNQLDMRRPQELVDRQQFLQPVSAVLQGARIAGEAAGIARAVDHRAAPWTAQARPHCAAAPARGGSSTTASKASSSVAVSGLRNEIAAFGRHACRPAGGRPPRRRRSLALSLSNKRELAGTTQRQRAQAGKEISQPRRLARPRRRPSARIACSARWVACRKAPGGGSIVGVAEDQQRRASDDDGFGGSHDRPSTAAPGPRPRPKPTRASRRSIDRSSRRCGRISTSRPVVGFVHDRIGRPAVGQTRQRGSRATARAARRASGRATTQVPTSTISRARPLVEARHDAPALSAQHEVGAAALARRADQRRLEARRLRRRAAPARARSARPSSAV